MSGPGEKDQQEDVGGEILKRGIAPEGETEAEGQVLKRGVAPEDDTEGQGHKSR